MPGGVCGGASCAISHNLQSNSSRCSRRPMTSTPSNHKRLNLNGRYELRWRNLRQRWRLGVPPATPWMVTGRWQLGVPPATPWMVTGRWQLGVAPATPYGRRLAAATHCTAASCGCTFTTKSTFLHRSERRCTEESDHACFS
jgi:hypothetical protein